MKNERQSDSKLKLLIRVFITFILIAIQLLVYYFLIIRMINIPGISLLFYVFSLIVVSYIYNTDKNISYKLTWTIVCFAFNIMGPIIYLLFGNGNNLPKRKNKKILSYLDQKMDINNNLELLKKDDEIGYKHALLLHNYTFGYPIYKNTKNTFYNDGLILYNSMLDKIKSAKKFIFLEFFIIGEGQLFDELFPILTSKASDGIEIKIIYDAIGSGSVLRSKVVKELNKVKNIEMVAYNPWGINFNLATNYRDHRKVLIVDGLYSFVGGMNLHDEYIHKEKRFGFWRDNGMLIEGSACYSYTLLFAQNWYMSTKKMLLIDDYKPIYEEQIDNGYVFAFGDGPTNSKNPSYNLFLSMINNAKKSIYISTPYFIIDSQFIQAITTAINSGIDVKILIPGIPDKKIIYQVTQTHLKKILEVNGCVYEYTPGFNHAKNIVVDGKYAFVGTVNLDYRSLFLHFECGNLLINTDSVKEIEKDFLDAVKQSKKLELDEWKKRSLINKTIPFVVSILGPLL